MVASKGVISSNHIWISLLLGFLCFLWGGTGLEAKERDPNKIVGPDECGECHKPEVGVWRETHHFKTYKELPRKKKAKEIAEKMGVKRLKKDSACLQCHFTSGLHKGKVKAIAGISCEMCHGPAKDWIKPHADYGGKKLNRQTESPEHKAKRLAEVKAAGLIRPSELYSLAQNCYGCHTVPNEKLVNVGGHKAGSDFELVAWSQGEVRHKFILPDGKSGDVNQEATPERKRMLYIMGQALDLEFSLRSLAKATEKGKFSDAMTKRVQDVTERLKKIKGAAAIPEIDAMLSAAGGVELKFNNEAALIGAADKVATAAKKMADAHDGSKLGGLDALLPTPDKYKRGDDKAAS